MSSHTIAGPPERQNAGRNQIATQPSTMYSEVLSQRGAPGHARDMAIPAAAPPQTMPSTRRAVAESSSATDRGV
ncbi:hypothetical protein ADENT20671_0097 [Actinomyces denticolens]|nr:hypothetical protein ADENT20671_0097 [Actinomyces denticolens]